MMAIQMDFRILKTGMKMGRLFDVLDGLYFLGDIFGKDDRFGNVA